MSPEVRLPQGATSNLDLTIESLLTARDEMNSYLRIGQPRELMSVSSSLSALEFRNKNNKTLKIDFSGDCVNISGDMAISEAAKLFFQAVFQMYFNVKK